MFNLEAPGPHCHYRPGIAIALIDDNDLGEEWVAPPGEFDAGSFCRVEQLEIACNPEFRRVPPANRGDGSPAG